jgi:peroxiredoxin
VWDASDWKLRGKSDGRERYGKEGTLLGEPFSPDGRLLALCGTVPDPDKPGRRKAEVTLLDAATLREVAHLPGAGPLYSPDKKTLVTWRGDTATVWDARTYRKKLDLQAAAELRGLEIAFSRDGTLLFAATKSGRGHLWEVDGGKERATVDGFLPGFAADGKALLTHLPGGVVKLWDTATGKERASLKPLGGDGCWAEFVGDGKYILTTPAWFTLKADGTPDAGKRNAVKPQIKPLELRLWDAAGKEVARLPGQDKFRGFARPSPDGKLVGYIRLGDNETERRELVLWDLAANKERAVIRTAAGIHYFEFSPDGAAVFTRDPGLLDLRVWDAASGKRLPDVVTKTPLIDLRFSRDGKLFAAAPAPRGSEPGAVGKPVDGPADVLVFRLSDRELPPPVLRGEPAKAPEPPEPPEEPKRTKVGQALADLEKESEADAPAQTKLAARAVRVVRDHPRDPAALEALEFALRRTAGDFGDDAAKVRDEAFALIRKEFVNSPDLSRLRHFIAYQRTDAADELLRTLADDSPHRAVRGRAALRLAESLAEKAETVRLLRAIPELPKHPDVRDKAAALERLAKADADALARRAEEWYGRVKDRYADVAVSDDDKRTLGPAADGGLFALRNLALGKAAPDIEGDDLDGKKFKLSDYRGKVVVLIFCGHWCGPCRQMNPRKQNLVKRHADKPFALLEVNSDDDREAVKRTVAKEKLTWRCWFDGGREGPIARRWHVRQWPTIFVLDAAGVIRYKELRGDLLDQAVDTLLAEAAK